MSVIVIIIVIIIISSLGVGSYFFIKKLKNKK